MSLARVNQRGQITIPARFRKVLDCKEGDYVEIILDENTLKIIPKELIDKSQSWFWTKKHQEEESAAELFPGKRTAVKNAGDLIDELNK
ncbi:MAG: AbrB/MazE/SpoVT family DNA-binding domain-containing protein [Candidatus Aminicenantes bacterium]|nr:AbrB/MazE/SpoVT family DNA-binding domain-containing protein [Candidatus Aminicenantes bacterium]